MIVNDVNANVAYVEQQRKRREENTTKPRRFPIKPSINNIIHIQSITTMMDTMIRIYLLSNRKRCQMTVGKKKKKKRKKRLIAFLFAFLHLFKD